MSENSTPAAVKPTTFQVRNVINSPQLKADLSYSLADLSGAMMNQAGLFSHYADLAASTSKQVDDLELLIEVAESKVFRNLRDKLVAEGEKVVVAALEKEVSVHPQVVGLKKALNAAKQVESVAKGAVEAFRQRKDMLVQHGADGRQEREGDLRIMSGLQKEANREAVVEKLRQRITNEG